MNVDSDRHFVTTAIPDLILKHQKRFLKVMQHSWNSNLFLASPAKWIRMTTIIALSHMSRKRFWSHKLKTNYPLLLLKIISTCFALLHIILSFIYFVLEVTLCVTRTTDNYDHNRDMTKRYGTLTLLVLILLKVKTEKRSSKTMILLVAFWIRKRRLL